MKETDHPNIGKMVNNYEDKGHYCLVMELMHGGEVSVIQLYNFCSAF